MEHLSLHCNLNLNEFCSRLTSTLNIPDFEFDFENETEWGETIKGDMTINVSKPFKSNTLQTWDDSVPNDCNFGISITKKNIELDDIIRIGQLIADEFKTTVYYHRTWIHPGRNIKRRIKIKTSYNNGEHS